MTKECFQNLCSSIIVPYIKELLELDKNSGCSCLKYKEKRINKIYRVYEKKRQIIRRYFMNLESKPMDRHKIGSVLIYSILKSHIFKITKLTKQKLPYTLLMANEYLAVYVALSVVESYRIDDNDGWDNENYIKFCLEIPLTFHDESPNAYIDNLCKALFYLRNTNEFDIFAYANILFLLEAYTKKGETRE